MTNFKDFLTEQLEDPEIQAEWDKLQTECSIVQAMIDTHHKSGLPQKQLADKTGIAFLPSDA